MKFKKNMYLINNIIIFLSLIVGYPLFLALNLETPNIFNKGFLKFLMSILEIVIFDVLLIFLFQIGTRKYIQVFDDKIVFLKGKKEIQEICFSEISVIRYGNLLNAFLMKNDIWGLRIETFKGDLDLIISKKKSEYIINKFYNRHNV